MTTDTKERLIDADSHVDVSHDTVKSHLASKFHDDYDAGVVGYYESLSQAFASRPRLPQPDEAERVAKASVKPDLSDLNRARGRPGHTDGAARLRDMDMDGIDVASSYSEVSAFRYLYLIKNGWKESTRAFNSSLAEWASADPSRLIVSYQVPIHDIDAAVDEVKWALNEGCKSLQLPLFPGDVGQAEYCDPRYEPLFALVQEAKVPICLHSGFTTSLDSLLERDPTPDKSIWTSVVALTTAEQFGMWILGGVFEKFPELKVVFVETGTGWVPSWLFLADEIVLGRIRGRASTNTAITELPSHYFRQNCYLTFMEEMNVMRTIDDIGIGNFLWSTDYPHPPTTWPYSRKAADETFVGVSPEDRKQLVSGNAARVWNL